MSNLDIFSVHNLECARDMVEEGTLGYEEKTGKGGYHRVYYPLMDREVFQKYITEKINNKLEKIFSRALACP